MLSVHIVVAIAIFSCLLSWFCVQLKQSWARSQRNALLCKCVLAAIKIQLFKNRLCSVAITKTNNMAIVHLN